MEDEDAGSGFANPTYAKPKILLIDLEEKVEESLVGAGFNVSSGTFGTRFEVKQGNHYDAVAPDYSLPGLAEQEIIIVDLTDPPLSPKGKPGTYVTDKPNYFVNCSYGVVTNRPTAVSLARNDFEQIESHGGVFVVFAAPLDETETVIGTVDRYKIFRSRGTKYTNWGMLPLLDSPSNILVERTEGNEIILERSGLALDSLLERYIPESYYSCAIKPKRITQYGETIRWSNRDAESWKVLARNKYGKPVAGAFLPQSDGKGYVIILPQIKQKAAFVLELVRDILPEMAPSLFPDSGRHSWISSNEYQSEEVTALQESINRIIEEANRKVEQLQGEISQARLNEKHLTDLLTETDRPLVLAVHKTLIDLGFKEVIDCDNEDASASKNLDEDLQILDPEMTALTEVKGIGGLPKDDDILQVLKHVPNRMREWNRTNVKGLVIVNQQRSLPALNRQNTDLIRPDLLNSAAEQQLGILTTLDLFKLARSFKRNMWDHENIRDLFFQSGRIEPIPSHYQFIGIVENYFEQVSVIAIKLTAEALKSGDRIGLEFPLDLREAGVISMQIDNNNVELAEAGQSVGLKIDPSIGKPRKGTRVFRLVAKVG